MSSSTNEMLGYPADARLLILKLAQGYGVALRVDAPYVDYVHQAGKPGNTHKLLDSYRLDPASKAETYADMLRALPAGLTEWALHPGLETEELKAAIGPSWDTRKADFDFFTPDEAKTIVEEEGIIILSYEKLQPFWKS